MRGLAYRLKLLTDRTSGRSSGSVDTMRSRAILANARQLLDICGRAYSINDLHHTSYGPRPYSLPAHENHYGASRRQCRAEGVSQEKYISLEAHSAGPSDFTRWIHQALR